MDFSIWFIPVSTKKYQTVNALEIALSKIPSDHIRAACEAFPDRSMLKVAISNNNIFLLKFEMFIRYTEVFK